MYTLLKEHRYRVQVGIDTHIFVVEERIDGQEGWGGTFRLRIPASVHSAAKTFYGANDKEVAEQGARFLSRQAERFSF